MELTPRPEIHKKLKAMAQQQGLTLNALLVPFLNDIATGQLTRSSHYTTPREAGKAA